MHLPHDDPHAFLAQGCTACHGGDAAAADKQLAHRDLIDRPGELARAAETCGVCHRAYTDAVIGGLMHTGKGMVSVTRYAFGDRPTPHGDGDLSKLGNTPADSLLRKRCASCHLGQPGVKGLPDPVRARGGGCLACHLNDYPSAGHPILSARVRDERCFGCHSRSARIALNYAGLAEVDDDALSRPQKGALGRLSDGRLVESRHADIHHRAGLGCIDCHTVADLMGPTGHVDHGSGAVDIQCLDCHANQTTPVRFRDWPEAHLSLRARVPFPSEPEQLFLRTERRGTPLWHIRVTARGNFLYRKLQGGAVRIPEYRAKEHPAEPNHGRLSCDACHSRWAPQCYGCHMQYGTEGMQWDHTERRLSPGVWYESRWAVRNDAPPLGVDREQRIKPFVPGMVMTVEHPQFEGPLFRRLFSPLSPHTTGPARTCAECHRSPAALGLGQGTLTRTMNDEWRFTPSQPLSRDGLALDAFATLDGAHGGETTRAAHRPFTPEEIRALLDLPLAGERP